MLAPSLMTVNAILAPVNRLLPGLGIKTSQRDGRHGYRIWVGKTAVYRDSPGCRAKIPMGGRCNSGMCCRPGGQSTL